MAIIRCKGSKAKAVGLSGNPWRKVFSDVNWSWFKDSMTSCSKLAGPPVLPFHEKVMYLLYIFSFNYSIPKIIFFKWNWILPVPWPWLAPGGVGEFTLWRKLSSTPLIETNLFTLLEDILKIWRFFFLLFIYVLLLISSNILIFFNTLSSAMTTFYIFQVVPHYDIGNPGWRLFTFFHYFFFSSKLFFKILSIILEAERLL